MWLINQRPGATSSRLISVLNSPLATIAQQSSSSHRYALYFKYADQAIEAMTDDLQDNAAAASKLSEAL